MKFYYVSAPSGSGKTTAAIEHAGFGAIAGEKFIIAQPSIDLMEQTLARFKERWPDVAASAIHSKNSMNVAVEIARKSENSNFGQIVFITHAALLQNPWIHQRAEWHLIVDEVPSPIWDTKHVIHKHTDELFSLVNAVPTKNPPSKTDKYLKLVSLNDVLLREIAQNVDKEQVHTILQETARHMVSGNWGVYILKNQWDQLHKGTNTNGLLVFGLINTNGFDGFASTTLMSANFENTILSMYFRQLGHTFIEHPILPRKLQYTTHQNGQLLAIYYAVEHPWSKRQKLEIATSIEGYDVSVMELIVLGSEEVFGDENFAKLYNKEADMAKSDPFKGRGVLLPHSPHGRNDFRHLHNAAILSALNPSPAFFAFLKEIAHLDPEVIRQAIYVEAVYQAATRISLRNPQDTSMCKIIVADRDPAVFLHKVFPGSSIHPLPGSEYMPVPPRLGGRPAIHLTEAQKAAAKAEEQARNYVRRKWKAENAIQGETLLFDSYDSFAVNHPDEMTATPHHIRQGDSNWRVAFTTTLWDSRAVDKRPAKDFEPRHDQHLISQKAQTADEFFAFLRDLTTKTSEHKHDNNLIMRSAMDLTKDPGHGHTIANHVFSQGIILDFDATDMTPEDVHRLLPYRMALYSSWSHTTDLASFRVVMPTMPHSYDAAEALSRMCVTAFEADGYVPKRTPGELVHGVDMSKMNAVSLFYLPSQRPDGFFTTFDGPDIDIPAWIKRCPADIVDYILNKNHRTEKPIATPSPIQPFSEAATAPDNGVFINQLRRTCAERGRGKGTGRSQLWSLAKNLSTTNLQRHEIEMILVEEADQMHNPMERRSEIDSLLKL